MFWLVGGCAAGPRWLSMKGLFIDVYLQGPGKVARPSSMNGAFVHLRCTKEPFMPKTGTYEERIRTRADHARDSPAESLQAPSATTT